MARGAPLAPMRRRFGNMAYSCSGACGSRHLSTIGLGGLGRRRSAHLPVWVVSSHAPSKCVFQNINLCDMLCSPRCPRIFFLVLTQI